MVALQNDPAQQLKAILAEHLPWHGARIGFLAQIRLALLKVRRVSLAALAIGFGGQAKVEFHYKHLPRFFRGFEIDQNTLARRLVRLFPAGDDSWRRTMDRTNWPFDKIDINFLVLGIAGPGLAWTYRAGLWLHEQQPIRLNKPSSGRSSPASATDSNSSATSP